MKEIFVGVTIEVKHGGSGRVKIERNYGTVFDSLIKDEDGKKMVANFEKLLSIFAKENMKNQLFLEEFLYDITYLEIFRYPEYFNENLEALINNLADEVNDLLTDNTTINRFELAEKIIKLMQSIENLKIKVS